jgi:hypothetical protein
VRIDYPCDADPTCLEDGKHLTDFGLACEKHRTMRREDVVRLHEEWIKTHN